MPEQTNARPKQTRLIRLAALAMRAGLPCQGILRKLLTKAAQPIVRSLADIERRMTPFSQAMERRFLDCGNELDSFTGNTESMVAGAEELIQLATGRDDAEKIVSETMAVLQGPLAHLDRCTTAMQAQIDTLRGCSESINRLLECHSRMQAVVAPLRVTQTMFRVEASRLAEESRGSFASLTDQIEVLHAQVRDSFSGQFQSLSGARRTLDSVTARLESEIRSQRQILDTKREHIERTLGKLTAEIARNSGREVELTSKSRSVSNAVGRVVVALQSQDIVAQRMAHIFEGLAAAEAKGEELESNRGSETGVAEVAGIRTLLEIQANQWAGVRAEIESSVAKVEASTSEILSTIDALDSECVFLNEFSEVTAAANGTIQVLLEIVEEVKTLISASVALAQDSRELLRPVEAVTGNLTGSVELLSHQMNLVALNAQLQAVQIGAGTGLEVLAAHTAGIAAEITDIGSSISGDLDQLRERLRKEMGAFLEFCDSGRCQIEFMETSGLEHEQKLHGIRDVTLTKLQVVGNSVGEVRNSARRIGDRARLNEADTAGLAWVTEHLETLAGEARESLPEGLDTPHEVELGEAAYTMESERASHRAVVDRLKQNTAGEQAAPCETGVGAGGEMELF